MAIDDLTERHINFYTDFAFKKLFGTEVNKDLLISFLNSMFNGQERQKHENTLKAYRDWFSVMETAEKKGEAKGRAEGRAEGRVEGRVEGIYAVAQKMKALNLPMDTIIQSTGLSAEEIETF